MATSFTVARRFWVWRYLVSHQTLVLRGPARFDAWFDGVAAMHLHQQFEPLTIRAAEPDEREQIFSWAAAEIHDVANRPPLCLILASSQPDGFLVCAHAHVQAYPDAPRSGALADDSGPTTSRTLWRAGPTSDPALRHVYREFPAAEYS